MAQQHELDIVGLVEVAGRPVSIADIATTLELDSSVVVETVEDLTRQGVLSDSPAGVTRGKSAFEVSSARVALLSGKWADALKTMDAPPLAIGEALQAAGRGPEATEYLVAAARAGGPESARAASLALEAGNISGEMEGELRLIRARHYRGLGRSLEAAADLEVAVRRLTGPAQVDAMGFAAAVADDRQHPAESATFAALGAGLASTIGENTKEGSLLTLLGRSLNRIGFPDEADASHAKGQSLLEEHGAPIQRFLGRMNEGWIHLDRGEMRQAEAIFSALRDRAMDLEGEVSLADKEAYWARALFGIGHISEGFAAQGRALILAEKTKSVAVEFLASIAGVEGSLAVGDDVAALEWADRALALSLEHLPAWENGMRALRARALASRGDRDAARDELEAAMALCPDGADGWRWRMTIRALAIAFTAEEATWPHREAEDLTDELLQARLYSSAVELMTARATREKDPELGEQAAALALQLGNPTLAAGAAKAADLWRTPLAGGVSRAVRAAESHIPAEQGTAWKALPGIGEALAVEPAGDPQGELLQQRIDDALRTAGLAGVDLVLSPAQRRSGGLVRRRRPRPSWIRTLAASLGVVGLTVLTVGIVNGGFGSDETTTNTTLTTTTTAPTTTSSTMVPVPENGLFGTMDWRGGPARTGQAPESTRALGFRTEPTGKYWQMEPGGDITNQLVAYGPHLYIATENPGQLVAIDQTTGNIAFRIPTSTEVRSPPTVARLGEVTYLAFGTQDGRIYAANALSASGTNLWEAEVGQVRQAGIIDGRALYLATDDGRLMALDLEGSGSEIWAYTGTEASPLDTIETSPALSRGILYVADRSLKVHVVDAADGTAVCEPFTVSGAVVGNPIIEDGIVYVPTRTGPIQMFVEGTCGDTVEGRAIQITNFVPVLDPPAVADGIVFNNEVSRVVAFDSRTGDLSVWTQPYEAGLGDPITTPPTIADRVIYFGTQSGKVHAVDAETGEGLWVFDVGEPIRGTLVVVANAVYVTTATSIIALAGG